MPTSFEYTTVIRTTRGTSGHEAEEMDVLLHRYTKDGWRLHSIKPCDYHADNRVELVIFEREKT